MDSLGPMLIGAHVPPADPLAAAAARGAEAVQIFLSSPQGWKRPEPREDAATLRVSSVPIYVHAPYIINCASTENRIRHPSRQNLQQTLDAAGEIGAAGVIVHGGHVGDDDDPTEGFAHWRTTLERAETEVPILIENTAGGDNAMARRVDTIERLWEAIDGVDAPVGFCLDTCHLHAALDPGTDLVAATERLRDRIGGIDLVHLNDSRDAAGSGRDRHTQVGAGRIDPDALVGMVEAADAPTVICETPEETQADDIAWIRERL